jgi:hypothetical protein
MTNTPYNSNSMYTDREDASVAHEIPLSEISTIDEALLIAQRYVSSLESIKLKLQGKEDPWANLPETGWVS